MDIDGMCHCGGIAYTATIDPAKVSICHCTDCQQLTGTAYRVSVPVPRENFQLTLGMPKTYAKHGSSGAVRYQLFCPDCGSPLYTTGEGRDAETIGIRWGSIRQRAALAPRQQKWCASALNWFGEIEKLPGRAGD